MKYMELEPIVEAVAEHLDGWTYNPEKPTNKRQRENNYGYIVFDGADGAEFNFHSERDGYGENAPKRIVVSGSWPDDRGRHTVLRDWIWDAENPVITMAAAKNPVKLAADIKRRFLPGYAELYRKVLLVKAKRDQYATVQRENMDAFAGVLGVEVKQDRPIDDLKIWHYQENGPYFRDVYVSAESFCLTIANVSPDMAVEIAKMVKAAGVQS